MYKKVIFILFFVALLPFGAGAQEYRGITGLLQTPNAETDSAGTMRAGVFFLHRAFLPNKYTIRRDYNTVGYYIGVTAWHWLELSYSTTLMKTGGSSHLNNEDRQFNVKFRPLREGRWWPAVALGSDDIYLEFFDKRNSNNYFFNLYISLSKHFDIRGYELAAHLGYRYYFWDENSDQRGVVGGLSFRPAFYKPLRMVVEWDGIGVNFGADVLLWRRLYAQAMLVHGRGFTGGLSYHYTIPF